MEEEAERAFTVGLARLICSFLFSLFSFLFFFFSFFLGKPQTVWARQAGTSCLSSPGGGLPVICMHKTVTYIMDVVIHYYDVTLCSTTCTCSVMYFTY